MKLRWSIWYSCDCCQLLQNEGKLLLQGNVYHYWINYNCNYYYYPYYNYWIPGNFAFFIFSVLSYFAILMAFFLAGPAVTINKLYAWLWPFLRERIPGSFFKLQDCTLVSGWIKRNRKRLSVIVLIQNRGAQMWWYGPWSSWHVFSSSVSCGPAGVDWTSGLP